MIDDMKNEFFSNRFEAINSYVKTVIEAIESSSGYETLKDLRKKCEKERREESLEKKRKREEEEPIDLRSLRKPMSYLDVYEKVGGDMTVFIRYVSR
jgi:hypothetical protein